jgi:outer membrane protein assembly factor BamB
MNLARLAGKQDPVVWISKGGGSACATPVYYNDLIFAVSGSGVASCTDGQTGRLLWRARLDGEYYSSPVAMAGNIYFTNDGGVTTVVAAERTYREIAKNDIGEPVTATMAAVGGQLYLRTHSTLYCIRP